MISIEKITKHNNLTTCNACHNYNDNMFNVFFTANGRNGTMVMLCEECMEETKKEISKTLYFDYKNQSEEKRKSMPTSNIDFEPDVDLEENIGLDYKDKW